MPTDTTINTQEPTSGSWLVDLAKVAADLAEKGLSSPWQGNTITLRNLLLATSVGLGLWLLGIKDVQFEPLDKLLKVPKSEWFYIMATLLHTYAVLAYMLEGHADMRIRRLKVLEPYLWVRQRISDIQAKIQENGEEASKRYDVEKRLIREWEEHAAKVDERYGRLRKNADARLDANSEDMQAYNLWVNLNHRWDRERDANRERIQIASSGMTTVVESILHTGAELNMLDDLTKDTWPLAKLRWRVTNIEHFGVLTIGFTVLILAVVTGVAKSGHM